MMQALVEIVEYIMGFGLSTAIAVFSIFILAGSSPLIGHFVTNSGGPQISDAAREAVLSNRTTSVSLYLSNASVLCSRGVLWVADGGGNFSSEVGSDCSFYVRGLSGSHTLTFLPGGTQLRMRVDT